MASEIRTRFINYMTLQGFSPHTKKSYLDGVTGLARFYNKSPDTLTNKEVQKYFLYLLEERKVAVGTCNAYRSGIVCFYRNLCHWDETRFPLPPWHQQKKLPVIFSEEEVQRLFPAAGNLKHRVLLKTAYSAGLRVSELVRLQTKHIESDPSRMLIRVEQGKGKKDRYTTLSRDLLEELRTYWCKYHPEKWLFPGQKPDTHLTESAAQRAYYLAKKKCRSQ
jgi:integrase/recombinase XerD